MDCGAGAGLFRALGGEADLVDLEAAEHVEHFHDALVLGCAVAADDDGDIRGGGLDGDLRRRDVRELPASGGLLL